MLGFIKGKAQQAKALVGEAVEASASAIVNSNFMTSCSDKFHRRARACDAH